MDSTTNDRCGKVTGYPMVCLVDHEGFRIGVGEKDIPELDGPDSWPECVEYDAIHYEISDLDELMALDELDELEAAAAAAEPWIALFIEGALPPIRGGAPVPEPDDSFDQWLAQLDGDGYPPANQCSPEEYSQLQAHGCV